MAKTYTTDLFTLIERQANRLISLLNCNAPDCIIAPQVMLLFALTWAQMPERMEKEFGQWMTKRARRYAGKCIGCGAPHSVDEYCDTCDLQFDQEANECDDILIESQLDEEEEAANSEQRE